MSVEIFMLDAKNVFVARPWRGLCLYSSLDYTRDVASVGAVCILIFNSEITEKVRVSCPDPNPSPNPRHIVDVHMIVAPEDKKNVETRARNVPQIDGMAASEAKHAEPATDVDSMNVASENCRHPLETSSEKNVTVAL